MKEVKVTTAPSKGNREIYFLSLDDAFAAIANVFEGVHINDDGSCVVKGHQVCQIHK